jgi:hypothetical protein
VSNIDEPDSPTEVDMTKAAHEAASVRHTPAHRESLGPLKEDAGASACCSVSTAGETLKRRSRRGQRCNDRQPNEGGCEKTAHIRLHELDTYSK